MNFVYLLQKRNEDPVKYPWWSFFSKIATKSSELLQRKVLVVVGDTQPSNWTLNPNHLYQFNVNVLIVKKPVDWFAIQNKQKFLCDIILAL